MSGGQLHNDPTATRSDRRDDNDDELLFHLMLLFIIQYYLIYMPIDAKASFFHTIQRPGSIQFS